MALERHVGFLTGCCRSNTIPALIPVRPDGQVRRGWLKPPSTQGFCVYSLRGAGSVSRPSTQTPSRAQGRRRDPAGATRTSAGSDLTRRSALTPAQQIGLFFRSARETQQLSQEQLADLTRSRPGRVSRAMISAVERGRHLPGIEVLLTLSQVLHVSPSEVLERLELARAEIIDTDGLSFEELNRQAKERFWKGDPRGAVVCYDAMLRLIRDGNPDNGQAATRELALVELKRGAALRRCGAPTAARSSIERSITLAEDLPDVQTQAYVVLVALLVQMGRLPLARMRPNAGSHWPRRRATPSFRVGRGSRRAKCSKPAASTPKPAWPSWKRVAGSAGPATTPTW